MNKISYLIIDDEPLSRVGLHSILNHAKDFKCLGEAEDGEEAVAKILKKEPNVIFLDIQMPEMDGFEVLANIPSKKMPLIIFVTAFDQFAIKAFKANALDYILKPFDQERIKASLYRVREMIRLKNRAAYNSKVIKAIQALQPKNKYIERIAVRSKGKISFIHTDDIQLIEADADYIRIYTALRKHVLRETMNMIEQKLNPAHFTRIHRSYIVRMDFIKELQPTHHGDVSILPNDGNTVSVSRRYKKNLPAFFK